MKVLFFPMDGHGHVNACVGLARILREFGHECIFSLPKHWTTMIEGHGFGLETFRDPEAVDGQDPQEKWGKFHASLSHTYAMEPKDQFTELIVPCNVAFMSYVKSIDDQLAEIIDRISPDVIIIDFYCTVPAVIKSGRPWLLLFSCNPLRAYDAPNTPPAFNGLKANDDPKKFMELRMLMFETMKELKKDFDSWLVSKEITPDLFGVMTLSPFLNLYPFPSDVDYSEFGPVPEKWFRLDHMVRCVDDTPLGFDESFFNLPDKKIYFSLGSMGGADVDLMHKLIAFLSKCKHKIIVSKGPFPDQIELAPNMVGGKYINQIKILPKVDLVITHGGNNTFVEALYFGKPMIVMPLFGDQHDNGRRAEDKKVGKCLYPHKVTEDQLLTAIDDILSDTELIERVTKIGENTRNSKSHSEFNKKLQEIVQ